MIDIVQIRESPNALMRLLHCGGNGRLSPSAARARAVRASLLTALVGDEAGLDCVSPVSFSRLKKKSAFRLRVFIHTRVALYGRTFGGESRAVETVSVE